MDKKDLSEIDKIIKLAIKEYQELGLSKELIEKRIKIILYPLIIDNDIYEYYLIK